MNIMNSSAGKEKERERGRSVIKTDKLINILRKTILA